MLNPFHDINWRPDRAERHAFARSLMIGFPIVGLALLLGSRVFAHHWKPFPIWLGAIGFCCGVVLWCFPRIARPFYLVWYFLGACIGLVMGNLLLALLFYVGLTPVGLLRRALGGSSIRRRWQKARASYWHDAKKGVDPKRYYRQF